MTPYKHHIRRRAVGMPIQAEVLLDLIRVKEKRLLSFAAIKLLALTADVGSPATLHKAIHWLLDHGYAEAVPHPRDTRAKLLKVTKKGHGFLGRSE